MFTEKDFDRELTFRTLTISRELTPALSPSSRP